MKTRNLLIALILLPNIIFAQEYCPFDFENGLWESRYYAAFSSNGVYRSEYNDYAVGDTLVNDSLLCYKLLRTGVQCFPDYYTFDCTPDMPFTQDLGVICEQDKRVYHNGNLLYDFNVEIGDTIIHWAEISSGSISQVPIIVAIDSVEVCGKVRKRFRTNYFALGDVYFVEGIGSSAGLIPRYEFFEDGASLSCYSDQNCAPCPFVTDLDETSDATINIYPNPFKENIRIETQAINYTITLLNQNGQVIKTFGNERSLDVAELPSGVYFLGIHSGDNIFYEKIVKYK